MINKLTTALARAKTVTIIFFTLCVIELLAPLFPQALHPLPNFDYGFEH